jgi:hypothetical protein
MSRKARIRSVPRHDERGRFAGTVQVLDARTSAQIRRLWYQTIRLEMAVNAFCRAIPRPPVTYHVSIRALSDGETVPTASVGGDDVTGSTVTLTWVPVPGAEGFTLGLGEPGERPMLVPV